MSVPEGDLNPQSLAQWSTLLTTTPHEILINWQHKASHECVTVSFYGKFNNFHEKYHSQVLVRHPCTRECVPSQNGLRSYLAVGNQIPAAGVEGRSPHHFNRQDTDQRSA